MFSSDKNVESLTQLIERLKEYFELKGEYLKIDALDKIVKLLSALCVTIITLILVVAVLFYFSFAIVYWLEQYVGMAGAFAIMGAAFLLLLILVGYNKKTWIEKPLVRLLTHILLSD